MPQATEELREEMRTRFGSIDTHGPEGFLKERGWTLRPDWTYHKDNQRIEKIPKDEWTCILFLYQEWDYGGLSDEVKAGG